MASATEANKGDGSSRSWGKRRRLHWQRVNLAYNLSGARCAYCRRRLMSLRVLASISNEQMALGHHPLRYPTLDHVVPRAVGGRTTPDNLVACCQVCNHTKGLIDDVFGSVPDDPAIYARLRIIQATLARIKGIDSYPVSPEELTKQLPFPINALPWPALSLTKTAPG